MALTPADPAYFLLQKTSDRITELERQVEVLLRAHLMSGQQARVQSFSGGTMVVVRFEATGTDAPAAFQAGWTPTSGDRCVVHDYGGGYFVAFPVSAF